MKLRVGSNIMIHFLYILLLLLWHMYVCVCVCACVRVCQLGAGQETGRDGIKGR